MASRSSGLSCRQRTYAASSSAACGLARTLRLGGALRSAGAAHGHVRGSTSTLQGCSSPKSGPSRGCQMDLTCVSHGYHMPQSTTLVLGSPVKVPYPVAGSAQTLCTQGIDAPDTRSAWPHCAPINANTQAFCCPAIQK